MKRVHQGVIALVALALLIQLVPVNRSNPPEAGPIQAPPEIAQVLATSCFDCHSHRTRWPWYASVAPVSWLVARDVSRARSELNFSTWDALPPGDQRGELIQLRRRIKKREMPLPNYLRMHDEAVLTDSQRQLLQDWALATAESIPL